MLDTEAPETTAYGQYCPVSRAVELLGERWTMLILRDLLVGMTRFNDLARGEPGLSRSLLTKRLRQLERAGLVDRLDGEYHLTDAGEALRPIVFGLGDWAAKYAFGDPRPSELDPELLVWWMHKGIDTAQLPDRRTVLHFRFDDDPRRYWIVVDSQGPSVCLADPGFDVDVTISADVPPSIASGSGASRSPTRCAPAGSPSKAHARSRVACPKLCDSARSRTRSARRPDAFSSSSSSAILRGVAERLDRSDGASQPTIVDGIRGIGLPVHSVLGADSDLTGKRLGVFSYSASVPLVIRVPGRKPYTIDLLRRMTHKKLPVVGTAMPVTVDRDDPSKVRIEWDEVPDVDDMIRDGSPAFTDPDTVEANVRAAMTDALDTVIESVDEQADAFAQSLDTTLAPGQVKSVLQQLRGDVEAGSKAQVPRIPADQPSARVLGIAGHITEQNEGYVWAIHSRMLLSIRVPNRPRYGYRWSGMLHTSRVITEWSDIPIKLKRNGDVDIQWREMDTAADVALRAVERGHDEMQARMAADPERRDVRDGQAHRRGGAGRRTARRVEAAGRRGDRGHPVGSRHAARSARSAACGGCPH